MDWNAVRDALVESTLALFHSCGIELTVQKPGVPLNFDEVTLAVMAFGSEEFKGSLVLSLSEPALTGSFPKISNADSEPDYLDWAGELANQLTGRVKNRLLVQGIAINLGTPTTLRGKGVHLSAARPGARLIEATLWYQTTPIKVRLEAQLKSDANAAPYSVPTQVEGEFEAF
jgi:CheY-specific phosphatase CheX